MPKAKPIPYTVEELGRMFDEREPGVLYWHKNPQGRKPSDTPAGTPKENGYWFIAIKGRKYHRHRLVYYMHTGLQPAILDHIDGVKDHDSFANLRPLNCSQNNMNRRMKRGNRGKYVGVTLRHGRYMARIGFDGKQLYLGTFTTPVAAAKAYQKAKSIYHNGFRNVGEPDLLNTQIRKEA